MAQKRLSVRKIKEVLRLKFEQNLSHSKIARSLNIGETTVGDYLRRVRALGLNWSELLLFSDEDIEAALFIPRISATKRPIVEPNWSYLHKERRRKGVTLQLLWEEYKAENPSGYQYTQFCHLHREYAKTVEYSFRNEHKGGEKLFIDYAGMTVPVMDPIDHTTKKAQIFLATFGASNFTYIEATWSQNLQDWIDSHQRAFAYFGGAPEILVPDNLKSGVTNPCKYDPDINPVYHEMARHYGAVVIPARVRKPKDKAKVENAVLVVERWVLAALRNRQFFSLGELNTALKELLERLNDRPFKKLEGSRRSTFEDLDKPCLKQPPSRLFEVAEFKLATVNINYHIEVDAHHYSVPYSLVKKKVEIRYTCSTIEVLYKNKRVASHPRSYARNHRYTTLSEHMPTAHQEYVAWTPERLSHWASQSGPGTQKIAEAIMASKAHPQQGFKSVLGLIRMGKTYGNDRLEMACTKALMIGTHSYKSIKSILKSNLDRSDTAASFAHKPLPEHQNIRGKSYYSL